MTGESKIMNNNKLKRILVIEDEIQLAEILQMHLQESGFIAEIANDGYVGKMLFEKTEFDLVILDINLPLKNGYELCKEMRKINSKVPVIMLTAFGSTENKIIGFESGADDYIVKPVDFRELLLRINVFLKRSNFNSYPESKLKIADLELDVDTKTVTRSGQTIDLTAKEFALLEILLKNKNKVISREYILQKVWDLDFETGTNVIDVYVNFLRKKIDRDFEPKLIHTKFGFGFYCSDKELI